MLLYLELTLTDLFGKCSENGVTVDETFKDSSAVILPLLIEEILRGKRPTLPRPPKNTAELGVGDSH